MAVSSLSVLFILSHQILTTSASCNYYRNDGPFPESLPYPIKVCAQSTTSSSISYECRGNAVYEYRYNEPNCQGAYTAFYQGACERPNCLCSGHDEPDNECAGTTFTFNDDEENVTVLLDQCIEYSGMDRIYRVNEDNVMEIEYFGIGTQCDQYAFTKEMSEYSIAWSDNDGDDSMMNHKTMDSIIIICGILMTICAVCCAACIQWKVNQIKAKKQEVCCSVH